MHVRLHSFSHPAACVQLHKDTLKACDVLRMHQDVLLLVSYYQIVVRSCHSRSRHGIMVSELILMSLLQPEVWGGKRGAVCLMRETRLR